jgi:hypothetical protein
MSHGCCQAGIPATHVHHAADSLQRLDSPPCTMCNDLSTLHNKCSWNKIISQQPRTMERNLLKGW